MRRNRSSIKGFDIISTATELFGKLISSFVTGDQVPDYPIKSKNTLKEIIAAVQAAFPDPTSVTMAQEQLARAKQWQAEAYAKGGAVNTTYGDIYGELIPVLEGYVLGAHPPLPGSTTAPTDPRDPYLPPPKPQTASFSAPVAIGIGVIALMLLSKKRR